MSDTKRVNEALMEINECVKLLCDEVDKWQDETLVLKKALNNANSNAIYWEQKYYDSQRKLLG